MIYPITGETTQTVRSLSEKKIHGFITPPSWGYHLRTPKGRPYTAAIVVLARIVDFYQPIYVTDTSSGRQRIFKKFAGDRLQMGPSQLANMTGLGLSTVKRALGYLIGVDLVMQDVLPTAEINGAVFSNVSFLDIWPEAVAKISAPESVNHLSWHLRYHHIEKDIAAAMPEDSQVDYRLLVSEYATVLANLVRQRIAFGSSVAKHQGNELTIIDLAQTIIADYHGKEFGGVVISPETITDVWERYWEVNGKHRNGRKPWLGDLCNDIDVAIAGAAAHSTEAASEFGEMVIA